MHRRPTSLVVALLALLGSACGLAQTDPDWVTLRNPLPACGVEEGVELDLGARTCILEAHEAGDTGELISRMTSIEGDPIVRYTRVHANGVVEIFHDATRDRFGSGRWERLVCERLVPDPQLVFVEEDCMDLPIP